MNQSEKFTPSSIESISKACLSGSLLRSKLFSSSSNSQYAFILKLTNFSAEIENDSSHQFINQGRLKETHCIEILKISIDLYFADWLDAAKASRREGSDFSPRMNAGGTLREVKEPHNRLRTDETGTGRHAALPGKMFLKKQLLDFS